MGTQRLQSFMHALNGFREGFSTETNFRIHLCALAGVIIAGLALQIGSNEWALLVLASGMVLSAELLNTAIESLCDALHPAQAPAVGRVKDLAAGGVLAASVAAAICGFCVLGSAFLQNL